MRGKTREDAVLLLLSLHEQVNILVQYFRDGEFHFTSCNVCHVGAVYLQCLYFAVDVLYEGISNKFCPLVVIICRP